MKKRLLLIGCVLMMSTAAVACSSTNQSTEAKQETTSMDNSQAQGSASAVQNASSATKMPEFKTNTTEGEEITSDVFKKSKLTVVNLWGSWCQPCVEEIPELQKLYENMKDKGVNVIGVAQDGDTELDAVKEIIAQDNVTYTNIIPDEDGPLKGFVMSSQLFPNTFLVDSEGNIVANITGGQDLEGFTKAVEDALAKLN
mgnify:FL=1